MVSEVQRRMVMAELADAERVLSQDVNVVAMSYSDFLTYGLPVLATVQSGDFNAQNWIRISGHPSQEVSVVDDITGEEKYRIPALLGHTDLQEVEEFKLARVADHAAIIRQEAPGAADQQLYDHLSLLRPVEGQLPKYRERIVTALNQVFRDHSLPLIETEQTADAPKPAIDEPEIIGYDLA
jgi:hypothetical protein